MLAAGLLGTQPVNFLSCSFSNKLFLLKPVQTLFCCLSEEPEKSMWEILKAGHGGSCL
jgi:hypothetical protein